MILTGNKISNEVKNNKIIISPFNIERLSTNSYDITLSDTLIEYTSPILDPKKKSEYKIIKIPNDGYILPKNSFHLGSSNEIIGSEYYVPILHAKSGIARLGLFVHITADLIDIGSIGNITFQLYSTLPVKVYKDMKIGQMSFWKPHGRISLYDGKYMNSRGPQISKTYLDWK